MNNDIFHLHKGEMGLVSGDGISLISDSKDMFLFSEKTFEFCKDFKIVVDLTKITRFGGFQIRFFYDYQNKVFYGIYFIHSDLGYEIKCVNNNNSEYRWSFSRTYGIVPNDAIYKNGSHLFYHGDDFCRIELFSHNGFIDVLVSGKIYATINILEEIDRSNEKVFDNIVGKNSSVGFDACISQNIIRNFLYKSNKSIIVFEKNKCKNNFIINFRPEVVFEFEIDKDFLEKICSCNFFEKIIIKKHNLNHKEILEISEKCNAIICFTFSDKSILSMSHETFTFVVSKKDTVENILNKFLYFKENLCFFIFYNEEFKIDKHFSFYKKDRLRQNILDGKI